MEGAEPARSLSTEGADVSGPIDWGDLEGDEEIPVPRAPLYVKRWALRRHGHADRTFVAYGSLEEALDRVAAYLEIDRGGLMAANAGVYDRRRNLIIEPQI